MLIGKHFVCYSKTDGELVSVLLENKTCSAETLLFESGAVARLSQWETESIRKSYSKVVDAYGSIGVLKLVIAENESLLYLVLVTSCTSVGKFQDNEVFRINSTHFVPLQDGQDGGYTTEVWKLLNSGTFYFAVCPENHAPIDLSLCAQRRHEGSCEPDNRFFWNRMLHFHLQRFGVDCSRWLLRIMCGAVEIRTIYAGVKQAKACLISRLSSERAGTRFYVRGTNDDGHVANFVETEQLIVMEDMVTSFVQNRGSVPLFWEQPGIQPSRLAEATSTFPLKDKMLTLTRKSDLMAHKSVGSHKVRLSRGFEASSPAFDRHLSSLKAQYGQQLLINLLGCKEGENLLSVAFQDQLKDSIHGHDTPMICFDYHRMGGGGRAEKLAVLRDKAKPFLEEFKMFHARGESVVSRQRGVLRINCLDCIDRTNNVQTYFGLEILQQQIQFLGLDGKPSLVSRFQEAFRQMWQQNGDHTSRIYVGTGALDGKARVVNKLRDGAKSVRRTIQSNFQDGSKQEAIDMLLLGNTFVGELGERARALLYSSFLHSSPTILRELVDRHLDYTTWSNIRVCIGTWNVNGGRHFRSIAHKQQTMHDWLLDFHKSLPASGYTEEPGVDFRYPPTDIFAIGFEELVDLNASNIVSTSANQRKAWGEELRRVISRDTPYVLVTCEQLVGVCLFVFIRPHLVPYLRDVAVSSVKTGLGGSTGNKGGVAITLQLHATSLCFVCSHLAAGQSNVKERNSDYHDIISRIAFPMGRKVSSHDYVFWCGDFNYRVDLPIEEVKEMVKQKKWDELTKHDQLTVQREQHKVFRGFIEGKLSFAPTYKYDLFSDDYDTSEKLRNPAWTDRVLWRRRKPKCKSVAAETTKLSQQGGEATREDNEGSNKEEEDEDEDEDEDEVFQQATATGSDGKKNALESSTGNIQFTPGKLLYYGRAELKTSDHRPVIALIEIDIQHVDWSKQRQVHNEVMKAMGPADPTVVITSDEDGIDVSELLIFLEPCGNVVLVRVVDDDVLVTFEDSRSSLEALKLSGKNVGDNTVHIRLMSDSLLSSTDLTVESLVSQSNVTSYNESVQPQIRSRALSDLLSSPSDHAAELPVLEPIKIQSEETTEDSEDDEEEEDEEGLGYDSSGESDVEGETETKGLENGQQVPEIKKEAPKRPAQPRRPPPPKPAVKTALPPATHQVKKVEEILVGSTRADVGDRDERLANFDPLTSKDRVQPRPNRPPPPKRPANVSAVAARTKPQPSLRTPDDTRTSSPSPKLKPKPKAKSENLQNAVLMAKRGKTSGGSSAIGTPFNVQHLTHVGADNIEALLLAAQENPKIIPFLAASSDQPNEAGNELKSAVTASTEQPEDQNSTSSTKQESHKQSSATAVLRPHAESSAPKPRPRSLVEREHSKTNASESLPTALTKQESHMQSPAPAAVRPQVDNPTPAPRPRSPVEREQSKTNISKPPPAPRVKPKPLSGVSLVKGNDSPLSGLETDINTETKPIPPKRTKAKPALPPREDLEANPPPQTVSMLPIDTSLSLRAFSPELPARCGTHSPSDESLPPFTSGAPVKAAVSMETSRVTNSTVADDPVVPEIKECGRMENGEETNKIESELIVPSKKVVPPPIPPRVDLT